MSVQLERMKKMAEVCKPLEDFLIQLKIETGVNHVALVDSSGSSIHSEEDHKQYCRYVASLPKDS